MHASQYAPNAALLRQSCRCSCGWQPYGQHGRQRVRSCHSGLVFVAAARLAAFLSAQEYLFKCIVEQRCVFEDGFEPCLPRALRVRAHLTCFLLNGFMHDFALSCMMSRSRSASANLEYVMLQGSTLSP